jgi:hypothetical protein
MQLQMGPNNGSATIIVSRANNLFNYTQFTTVYQGLPFVNMTATVDSAVNGFSLNHINFNDVESKGTFIPGPSGTVSWIDQGVKAFGQLIFQGNQPNVQPTLNNACPYDVSLQYSFGTTTSQAQIQIIATTYSVIDSLQYYRDQNTINDYFAPIIAANLNASLQPTGHTTITTFDYQAALQYYNVSYLANFYDNFGLNPKFASDPKFSLVFINDKVAIFKVEANANQAGKSKSYLSPFCQ